MMIPFRPRTVEPVPEDRSSAPNKSSTSGSRTGKAARSRTRHRPLPHHICVPLVRGTARVPEGYITCVPLVPLKAAAGTFSNPQHIQDDEFEWVEVASRHRLRKGMFVAQVVGKSMEPAIADGAWCLFRAPVEGTRQSKTVLVNGGGIMLHARRPGGPVAAAQNCATHGPLSVATRGRRCTAWSSMRRFDWRLSTRV